MWIQIEEPIGETAVMSIPADSSNSPSMSRCVGEQKITRYKICPDESRARPTVLLKPEQCAARFRGLPSFLRPQPGAYAPANSVPP